MNIEYADVVADLSWGDTGKGKVTSALVSKSKYDFVCRWAGGNNAGHTVFLNGKKYKTHLVPSGVFHGIPSIIGPGCVVNREALLSELEYIKECGFDSSLVKVSPRAHMVTDAHISKDKRKLAKKLGTTSKGIAPSYADKMARVGVLAKDALPAELIWDEVLYGKILCEGAQGFYLDIDHGNYPYVTSSTTLPYGACSLGIPPQKIRKIYGTCKVYDTRSGVDPLFPTSLLDDPDLSMLGDLGEEYGVTTGRRRIVNWFNLDMMLNAVKISGATDIIFNKADILKKFGKYKLFHDNKLKEFNRWDDFTSYISEQIGESRSLVNNVHFSGHSERI